MVKNPKGTFELAMEKLDDKNPLQQWTIDAGGRICAATNDAGGCHGQAYHVKK
jgi:hypothetical protein